MARWCGGEDVKSHPGQRIPYFPQLYGRIVTPFIVVTFHALPLLWQSPLFNNRASRIGRTRWNDAHTAGSDAFVVRARRLMGQPTDSYLEEQRALAPLPSDPQELATALIRDRLITYCRAMQLLKGEYRGFTIG